jgi:sulfatase maturation enzyme AslB (radical SAM superfamily)
MSNWKTQVKENDAFCIMPFNHMHVGTDGHAKLCCIADWKNPLSDDITSVSMRDLWKSETYQQIRKDMLAGKKVEQCKTCYHIEEHGGGSDRTAHNGWFNPPEDWDIDVENGNNYGTPMWVDWRPGRFCNFGCRMCFVGVSSTVADEHRDNPYLSDVTGESWFDVTDWIEDDKTFNDIIEWVPHLKTLKIAGGEPFFMPGVIKLLRWCVENKQTHLHLDITTNGSRMQGKVLKWLKSFRDVDIQFSIDGVGYTNDYIRYGAEWDKIDAAYKQYLDMGIRTHLLATVQAYNAYDIPNIVQYWKDNGSHNNLILNFVDSPSDMTIDILPYADRISIMEELMAVSDDIAHDKREMFRINAVIQRLGQNEGNDNFTKRKQFAKRTDAYDVLRKQSISLVHTRLKELVDKWKKMN